MIEDKENSFKKNPKDLKSPDSSIIDTSFNEISEYMNKVKDQKYKDYIQKKYELIVKAFKKIDKDSNSYIDFPEMYSFLNEGMQVIYKYILFSKEINST